MYFSYFLNTCGLVLTSRSWWKTGSFPLKWVKVLEHFLCFPYPSSLLIFCSFIKSIAFLSTFYHLSSLSVVPVLCGKGWDWDMEADQLVNWLVFQYSYFIPCTLMTNWQKHRGGNGHQKDGKEKTWDMGWEQTKCLNSIWGFWVWGVCLFVWGSFFAKGKPLSLGCLHSMKQNN